MGILYKIVHGIDNIDYNLFFKFSHVTFTRGDKYKIYVTCNSTSIRQNSFISRTVKSWNKLSLHAKCSESLNAFKNAIDKELVNEMYVYDE